MTKVKNLSWNNDEIITFISLAPKKRHWKGIKKGPYSTLLEDL